MKLSTPPPPLTRRIREPAAEQNKVDAGTANSCCIAALHGGDSAMGSIFCSEASSLDAAINQAGDIDANNTALSADCTGVRENSASFWQAQRGKRCSGRNCKERFPRA